MLRVISTHVAEAKRLPPAEAHAALFALQRIILQHYCVSLAEWIISQWTDDHGELKPKIDFDQLRKAPDGTLASLACDLAVAAENIGWRGLAKPIWESIGDTRPCMRLMQHEKPNLEGLLAAQVRRRNDGASGHGLPGGYDTPAESDAIELILERLKAALPLLITDTSALVLAAPNGVSITLKLLKAVEKNLVCYRNITSRAGGRCKVQAQVMLSVSSRADIEYETDDILSLAPQKARRLFEVLSTSNSNWSPLGFVPDRQTDVFTGREDEVGEIANWLDDEGSRACLIYGDGGIGKTTFALECIHKLFEGKLGVGWKPDLISYYTAKRTRWGVNGLEIINPATLGASDALLNIKRSLEGQALDREWYSLAPEKLIARVSTLLSEYGISRSQHLLVIDNCETLAQSEDEVRSLAKSLREISRYVGRVLVTSRRKEDVEARFVEILPLSEEEAEHLLRARGKELHIRHIDQAGGAKLRHYARRLGCKPLVLEVFVQILNDPSSSLDRAFNRVLQMQQQDLGEFLYADAWQRLSIEMKHLLLLMTRVADVHDDVLLKLCANEANVSVFEAHRAFAESRGIASVTTQAGTSEVAFLPEFARFCAARTVRIDGRDVPSEDGADTVRRRYAHFLKSSAGRINDRMTLAFRHPLARAAYRAVEAGNGTDAKLFYELATLSDSTNAALLDRYAFYLSSVGEFDVALDKATHAVQMEPNDPEFLFTKGIIESKSGLAASALQSLQRAEKVGKSAHLCALHKAYAYTKLSPPDFANARAAAQEASKVAVNDPYRLKHLADVTSVRRRIDALESEGPRRS